MTYWGYTTVISKVFIEANSKEEAEQKILNGDESINYGSTDITIEIEPKEVEE